METSADDEANYLQHSHQHHTQTPDRTRPTARPQAGGLNCHRSKQQRYYPLNQNSEVKNDKPIEFSVIISFPTTGL